MAIGVYPHEGSEKEQEYWRALLLDHLDTVLVTLKDSTAAPPAVIQEVLADLAEWWQTPAHLGGPAHVMHSLPLITDPPCSRRPRR